MRPLKLVVAAGLAAAALAASLATAATAAASGGNDRPLRPLLRDAAGHVDWGNLTRSERERVLRRWARAPALLDLILLRLAPRLEMRRTTGAEIAQGNFTEQFLGGAGTPRDWRVNLSQAVLERGGKLNAHLTLHELGHVVDGVLGSDDWRERLFFAFSRSAAWQPCWPMPPGSSSRCVRSNEILADQFAFWATGRREVRSSYGDPPLLHRAVLGARLAQLLEGASG